MSTAATRLPAPSFYKPDNAADWNYEPDSAALFGHAAEWAKKHGITASASDKVKVDVLAIDLQRDFTFPQGSLFVGGRSGRGAIEDNQRIAQWIYANMKIITDITPTMDTHFPFQIFSPSFWVDKDGQALTAHTVITVDMIKSGEAVPNPAAAAFVCNGNYTWLVDYVKHYCETLEKAGKYKLYLWPYHCLIGSSGHALAGVIQEARMFHSFVRKSRSVVEVKGGNFLSENYSVFAQEVLVDQDARPIGQRNTAFIKKLFVSDALIILGQASSHCVKSTIRDLLDAINAQDPSLAKKVWIMRDCMSAVTVPDGKGGFLVDYTDDAEESFKEFADAGMHVVSSDVAVEDWEGFPA